ncbi:MAG: hypothetical protein BWY72_02359 [Bacteroidetes bacterium ADurb.Bin416]|nr:MAG: hypothetical protein BWY72_02359 [Bacteroidetes bacterium ADurb.Bin416]
MNGMHGLDRTLDEIGRRPAERLQVGQNVDVGNVGGTQLAQRFVGGAPGTARFVGHQGFPVVLVHGVQLLVQGQGRVHDHFTVGIVGPEDDGHFFFDTQAVQTVPDSRQNGLGEPFHIVLVGVHGLTQTNQQANIGVLADKG